MRSLLATVLLLAACTTDQRPTMNPGVDCVLCHTQATNVPLPSAPNAAGKSAHGLVFSAAGTVFRSPDATASEGVENVHVLIHNYLVPDAGVELVTNAAGNFYTAEELLPATGLSVELEYRGQRVAMHNIATPLQLYGVGTPIVGVGCNGCHSVPAAPTLPPDAGPPPFCPALPDGGISDATAGEPCGGDLGCCSQLCVAGVCATLPGDEGAGCTSSADCASFTCVDGVCSATQGENGHGCTEGADCRLGYCEGGICTGAPGRISIPSALAALPDGGLGYGNL